MTVFLDANIVVYLIGGAHPNRQRSQIVLDELVLADTPLATDAEVFQEILHRYGAIDRPDAVQPAFATLEGLVDEVFPIGMTEVRAAKNMMVEGRRVGARAALHVASMRTNDVHRIFTFDRGFDRFLDLDRIA
ncbi:type II toxin-antitoxin system VapC family toxin [Nakamurella aerolata]|uniref:type II toxin-antitoxin system VapC family toxin n=1 Tax=Nakamurella aerolata TaxID=1656892 RepID=UPI001BB19F7F